VKLSSQYVVILSICMAALLLTLGAGSISKLSATASNSDSEEEEDANSQEEEDSEEEADSDTIQPLQPQSGSSNASAQNIQSFDDLMTKWDNHVINGEIDTLLFTGPSTWIATGDWKMLVADGEVTSFDTDMVWYTANGSASHTHEVRNFEWDGEENAEQLQGGEDEEESGDSQGASVPSIPGVNTTAAVPSSSVILNGVSEVGTNGNVVWSDVPTTLGINGGKVISILLGDEETDNHFARQNMYGIVGSITPCGDTPGANMQVPVPCE
jgi:hypothetical protein